VAAPLKDTWDTLPVDPALHGLEALRRPDRRESLLLSLLSEEAAELRLSEATVTVRRHAPARRCVLKTSIPKRSSGGEGSVLHLSVKIYTSDVGARAQEAMQEIRRHGFEHDPYRIPRTLGYDAASAILVSEWVEGCSIRGLLESGRDVCAAVDEAANWLRSLHASGYAGGRVYTWERQVETLETWGTRVSQCNAPIGRDFESLLRTIAVCLRSRGRTTWGPTHRDFSPEHVFIGEGSTTVLDFDEFCQYDPLFDVAHFIVHLRLAALRLHGNMGRFDDLAKRFLAAYSLGGNVPAEEHLSLYQAVSYLKHAFVALCVMEIGAREQIARILLTEARGALAERELRRSCCT
jgi:aminoglycoside phosphotransferase (APT) family kinase protein